MPIAFSVSRAVPADTAVLAVPVFAGGKMPPRSDVELDLPYLLGRDFEGKLGQAQPLLADDGTTILAVGMGEPGELDLEAFRRAGAAVSKGAWKAPSIATSLFAR